MSEYGYVEKPILEWLAGKQDDPADKGLGWTYRAKQEMDGYGRDETDAITEALLLPAIRRINPAVTSDDQARKVVAAFRHILSRPDPLDANQKTLEALRDGIPVVLAPGQDATTVHLLALAPDKHDLNDFTVTNQYTVRGAKGVRADTLLLVNGIPLVVAEYKSITASGHDWMEGVRQVHRYQEEAPALLVPNIFCVAADEHQFRFGAVAFKINSAHDIQKQAEHWTPWLSQYPLQHGYWTLPADKQDADAVRAAVVGLLRPAVVLNFLESFIVFETSNARTVKKLARYQQYEAANEIVDRVLEGCYKSGLIWHTQGSGKSLTMLFASYKLRRLPQLNNPTVFIVVDRTDLKTQLSDEFECCDYPNVTKALGVRDLKTKIRTDARETCITTIQCFQNMNDLPPNDRENIVLLVDEAHRTQKGKGEGFAMTMRAKLPRAYRFGLTGTPIDRTMVNTHRDFGNLIDNEWERYLSYYGIRQAIRDGATLEVYYEPHYVPILVNEQPLSITFEQMCEEMEVYDDEEKNEVQRSEARWRALIKDPRRVNQVITHMLEHFLNHPDPSGFKAQLVTVDRETCSLYKDALDAGLQARGLPPDWAQVIISAGQNDTADLKRFHFDKADTEKIITHFKWNAKDWEEDNRKKFGGDHSKWASPVKILIVCDKLLTGFDAPIEQVMYLDKPLRDHNLLQAIARTNRPYPQMDKRHGLVIDYLNVFKDLQKALNFDESVREEAVIDWEKLKEQVPVEIGKCMAPFFGIKIEDTRDCLLKALRRLDNQKTAQDFEAQFKRTQALWEAIAPDECLYDYRREYLWLCSMYIAHRRRNRRTKATFEELAAKTRELIQQHTLFMDIAQDVPVYRIDANYLTKVEELPTPADRAAELEAALNQELIEGQDSLVYRKLGERLKRVVELKESGDEYALIQIGEMENIVEEVLEEKQAPIRLGLTQPGEYALFTAIREYAVNKEETVCVQTAKRMMQHLRDKQYLPNGWADSIGGRQKVRLTLQILSWEPDIEPLQLCPVDNTDPPFLHIALDELAKAIK